MKLIRAFVAANALFAVAATPALAQTDYPTKTIKIIVPYSAGGIVDTLARVIGEKLSSKYGEAVVVENKPGAGGAIGTGYVAKAKPDGYTLLLASPAYAVAPSLQKSANWNPKVDFKSIAGIGVVPNVMVVHPSVEATSMTELIELARNSKDPMNYGTAGIGTSNHLSGELLAQQANIKLTQVAYKGQPNAVTDLLAGRITLMPLTSALALPHIEAGKLRALAVTTATRSSSLPEVPTVAEAANLPDYEVATWFGLTTPAETPAPVIEKLAADVSEILAMADVKAKLDTLGMELAPQNPAQFDAYVAKEYDKWSAVIKQAGIEPK